MILETAAGLVFSGAVALGTSTAFEMFEGRARLSQQPQYILDQIPRVRKWSSAYGIPLNWSFALIQTESSWRVKAKRFEVGFYERYVENNPVLANYPWKDDIAMMSTARGLTQIMVTTALSVGYPDDLNPNTLFEPDINLQFGLKFFKKAIVRANKNPALAYLKYNTGLGGNWLKASRTARDNNANFRNNLVQVTDFFGF